VCVDNVKFINVKSAGKYSNHYPFQGLNNTAGLPRMFNTQHLLKVIQFFCKSPERFNAARKFRESMHSVYADICAYGVLLRC
jgi:hypothetical protein